MKNDRPVFGGALSGDPFEYLRKVVGIPIAYCFSYILDIHRRAGQQAFRLLYPVLRQIGSEILMEALLEQLTEIRL